MFNTPRRTLTKSITLIIVMYVGLSIVAGHTDQIVQSELPAFLLFNNFEKLTGLLDAALRNKA